MVLAAFYNKDGKPVKTSLSERIDGTDLEDLRKMKEVLVLASGKEKPISMEGLLNLGLVDH